MLLRHCCCMLRLWGRFVLRVRTLLWYVARWLLNQSLMLNTNVNSFDIGCSSNVSYVVHQICIRLLAVRIISTNYEFDLWFFLLWHHAIWYCNSVCWVRSRTRKRILPKKELFMVENLWIYQYINAVIVMLTDDLKTHISWLITFISLWYMLTGARILNINYWWFNCIPHQITIVWLGTLYVYPR